MTFRLNSFTPVEKIRAFGVCVQLNMLAVWDHIKVSLKCLGVGLQAKSNLIPKVTNKI
jgi:hypothetical protein